MYKYVFFDLDGTITEPEEGIINGVLYALSKFEITVEDRTTLYPAWIFEQERTFHSKLSL